MDRIKFEILEDGTISIKTDAISPTNHQSADELLSALADLAGGEVKTESRRKGRHVHAHGGHHHHQHHNQERA